MDNCPKCGNPIKEDQEFCINCGYDLRNANNKSYQPVQNIQNPSNLPEMTFERLHNDTTASGLSGASQIVGVVGLWMDYTMISSIVGIVLSIMAKHRNPNHKSVVLANRGLFWSIVSLIIKILGILSYIFIIAAVLESSYYYSY